MYTHISNSKFPHGGLGTLEVQGLTRIGSARPGLENTAPDDASDIEPARLRWGARNGRSSPLGSAGALETAARARSAPLRRSKSQLELVRLRQGARNCSTWLLENTASADVSEVEPARLRWGARHRSSSPLGSAGPETLHWAGPRMPASLNRETNILVHGMHGHPLVYVYIYMKDFINLRT